MLQWYGNEHAFMLHSVRCYDRRPAKTWNLYQNLFDAIFCYNLQAGIFRYLICIFEEDYICAIPMLALYGRNLVGESWRYMVVIDGLITLRY
jgi:hypothetical protein